MSLESTEKIIILKYHSALVNYVKIMINMVYVQFILLRLPISKFSVGVR